ncbi:MAG: DUF1295 domain-containing protein [Tissierellales bacterium]|nr:DUF1295 domain-containing protein [Tissierellales bacterium]
MAGIDAKSVNLGFNYGISKVEGYEDYIETYEYEFGPAITDIDPSIQMALTEYYEGLADVAGTTYANYKISEADLNTLIEEGDDSIYILSIRGEDAYNEGHITGAELLPFGKGMQGEAVIWWGIYFTGLGFGAPVWAIISPITINVLVRYVSGVPLLEEKYKDREDFKEYKKKTPVFVPFVKPKEAK